MTEVYIDNENRKVFFKVDFIRGKLYEESHFPASQKY